MGKSEQHFKNAKGFMNMIKTIQLQPDGVMSLFTKMPIKEALGELHRKLSTESKDDNYLVDLVEMCTE